MSTDSEGAFVVSGTYPRLMPIDEDGINRDANGYDYALGPAARIARQQKIANEAWPMRDDKRWHARGIHDQPADNQRAVTVRLEFDVDGEVWLPGRAMRWNATHVYVVVNDPRVPNMAVWVRAADVRAR